MKSKKLCSARCALSVNLIVSCIAIEQLHSAENIELNAPLSPARNTTHIYNALIAGELRMVWPVCAREATEPALRTLLRLGMDDETAMDVRNALTVFPVGERADAADSVRSLLGENAHPNDILRCLSALKNVATADRPIFMEYVRSLMRPNIVPHEIAYVAEYVGGIKSSDRADYMTLLYSAIRSDMTAEQSATFMSRICIHSDDTNRIQKITRALLWARGIENVTDYASRITRVLETKLSDPVAHNMQALAQNAGNPYAIGINVHSDQRDKMTVDAVKALIDQGGSLSKADLTQNWDSFWGAVRSLAIHIENDTPEKLQARIAKQAAILRTLGLDIDGNAKRYTTGDFGGLVYEGRHLALSHGDTRIYLPAKELIARFWHFANNYAPPAGENPDTEHANLRQAVLNGIANGLQDDTVAGQAAVQTNHVVCDPGKIQRLAVATLQGRLRDASVTLVDGTHPLVDIDGLGLNTAAVAEADEDQKAPINHVGITNLREIAQYLQPWVRMIGEDAQRPTSAAEFFRSLFDYLQALKKGEVIGYLGQQIHLNPSDVVYYVGVMEPIVPKQLMVINPERSLYRTYAGIFGYQRHDFRTDDYMQQFGDREREQLAAAVEQRAVAEAMAVELNAVAEASAQPIPEDVNLKKRKCPADEVVTEELSPRKKNVDASSLNSGLMRESIAAGKENAVPGQPVPPKTLRDVWLTALEAQNTKSLNSPNQNIS